VRQSATKLVAPSAWGFGAPRCAWEKLDKARQTADAKAGVREEERIHWGPARSARMEATGPLTPASAPEGRSAEMADALASGFPATPQCC